jgi:uncharacterized protein (TIGR03083 family)
VADRDAINAMLEAEQCEFVTLLEGLDEEQWSAPSLCSEWNVHDVALHLAYHVHTGGIDLLKSERKTTSQLRSMPTDDLIEWVAQPVSAPFPSIQLGEFMIHQQDVRRPLGLPRDIPADRLVATLDYLGTMGGKLALVARVTSRSHGLHLAATDIRWYAGNGPEVRGPAESLMMALAGRGDAVRDLDGDGVTPLVRRMPRHAWVITDVPARGRG